MNIIYSSNQQQFKSKPTREQISKMQASFTATTTAIDNLIQHIENGKSFLCGTFNNNTRETASFFAQQVFAVDFDNTLTLQQAIALLHNYGLEYNFGYYTFSHTEEKPRFRLVFVLEGEVRNAQLVSDINHLLHKFFDKKTDKKALDIPRIWLGSARKCFRSHVQQAMKLSDLLGKINLKIYCDDRNCKRYCYDVKYLKSEKEGNTIIYTNNNSHILPINSIPGREAQALIEKWDIEDLLEYDLFEKFYNGKGNDKQNKLCHQELFGLATNLACLKGGRKLFKELLDKNKNYSKDKYGIIGYVISREFMPMHFKEFSTFERDINNPIQTFSRAVKKRGKIIINQEPELLLLEDAEKYMNDEFERIFSADTHKIYLMKCAAGMGKTMKVINKQNVVIAFPDHHLKDEQYNCSNLLDAQEKVITPDLKNKFSAAVASRFEILYGMDLDKNVMIELKELAKGNSITPLQTEGDIIAAQHYLEQMEEVMKAGNTKTIFTTHTRALQTQWLHDTVIFDEDPLNSILEQHSALKWELISLANKLAAKGYQTDNLVKILESPDNNPKPTPSFQFDKKIIYDICANQQFKSHVWNFFNSESYFVTNSQIQYCINNKHKFLQHIKYIICDATASEDIYRNLFGNRLEIIDLSEVKNKGQINQHTSHSCTRTGLNKYVSNLSIDNVNPTITFKDFKHHFKNATDEMHFGRVRGSNILSGRDINVVGTPHYNPSYYQFLCYSLNIENSDWKMKHQHIAYKGREFTFMTFTNPALQKIHLQIIEGEILQAVQRARLLRNDCRVNLYSNFPLLQAVYHY